LHINSIRVFLRISDPEMKKMRLVIFLIIIIFMLASVSCVFIKMNSQEFNKTPDFWTGLINFKGYGNLQMPRSVVISPDGNRLYVCAWGGIQGVYILYRDESSGWLDFDSMNPNKQVPNPSGLNISADGKYIYVCDGSLIYWFKIDPMGGGLSGDPAVDKLGIGAGLMGPIIMPYDGLHLYVYGGMSIYWIRRIDPATGKPSINALTDFYNMPVGISNVAVCPSGRHLYVSSGSRVFWLERDFATGQLKSPSPNNYIDIAGSMFTVMAISPSGKKLYVGDMNATGLLVKFSINEKTGALSGYSPQVVSSPTNIVVSNDEINLYILNNMKNTVEWYTLDHDSGNILFGQSISGSFLNSPSNAVVTPDGNNVYVTAQNGGASGTGGVVFFSRQLPELDTGY
jgi:DNA-binding beta-propeller fold protein YncE